MAILRKGAQVALRPPNLSRISKSYEFYFFIDNDIAIGVDDINTLFLTWYALRLKLFQAALTPDSTTAYPNLVWRGGCAVRFCDFVEIMMPVFSRAALQTCAHTFTESESGWGLDHVWPLYLGKERMAVVDAVQARHCRQVTSGGWVMSNGETPFDEFNRVVQGEEHEKTHECPEFAELCGGFGAGPIVSSG